MKINILKWCDDKISYLKENNIQFNNGIPQLPLEYIYDRLPAAESNYAYKKDIPDMYKKEALLDFFSFEERLWARLEKIDEEVEVMKGYAAVTGFDLSPSVGMLRPRQKLSILINAIYACYCGSKGVKVLPNYRHGDLGTIFCASYFPNHCNFIIGNHGCNKYGFRVYGQYITEIIVREKRPAVLFVYGSIPVWFARGLVSKYDIEIITFADRRNRIRNKQKGYHYFKGDDGVVRTIYANAAKGGIV